MYHYRDEGKGVTIWYTRRTVSFLFKQLATIDISRELSFVSLVDKLFANKSLISPSTC